MEYQTFIPNIKKRKNIYKEIKKTIFILDIKVNVIYLME